MNDNINVQVNGVSSITEDMYTYKTVVLKPNVVGENNILILEMIDLPNIKYVVRWNYNLNGETIEIPLNCMLEFDGGSFNNGTIVGNNTVVIYDIALNQVLNVTKEGTFKYKGDGKPNNEDINYNDRGELLFANREYDAEHPDGMGYIILRKDKTFTEQIEDKSNTIFEIRYDFDLNDETITIPENCILRFEGGSISNGTLVGNETIVYALDLSHSVLFEQLGTFIFNSGAAVNTEDIDFDSKGKLLFANRLYDVEHPNGMGYVILRKDKTFAQQVTEANTIYEIRYDFDLLNTSVTIPQNCTLHFVGGVLKNGILVCNNTTLSSSLYYTYTSNVIFNDTFFDETIHAIDDAVQRNSSSIASRYTNTQVDNAIAAAVLTETLRAEGVEALKANATDVYNKSEVYNKTEVYNKSEVYDKSEVYNKTEVYSKAHVYDKSLVYDKSEVYNKSETYTKAEVNGLVTTPNVSYVDVSATAETTSATDVLPATGQADTIYRIANWDGSAYDITSYSEYAWNGASYTFLAVKNATGGGTINVNKYNNQLEAYTDVASARNAVPNSLRISGLIIVYLLADGWYEELFIGNDTSNWSVNDNWRDIGPVSAYYDTNNGNTILHLGKTDVTAANEDVTKSVKDIIGLKSTLYDGDVLSRNVYSNALVTGNILNLSVTSGTGNVSFYGYIDDISYTFLKDVAPGTSTQITLSEDYQYIKIYSATQHHVTIEYIYPGQFKMEDFNSVKTPNLKEYNETGVTDDQQYHQYNTKNIFINDGEFFKIQATRGTIYIIWNDNTFSSYTNDNTYRQMVYPDNKTFKCVRVVTEQSGVEVSIKVNIITSQFIGAVDFLNEDLKVLVESGTSGTGTYPQYNTTTLKIPDNYYFNIVTGYSDMYIIWSDNSYTFVRTGWQKMVYPTGKTFRNIRVITPTAQQPVTVKLSLATEAWTNSIYELTDAFTTPIRALILGDSYSYNGGQWIRPMMNKLPVGSSYISLAVSSATLKDRYQDRITYPYTSRPVSTDNTGNHNTLACQIQKLKRLMAGTDLDEGETQIYTDPSEYPNVIIIAGGKNDSYDSDEVVDTYYNQLNKVVYNAYRKRNSASNVEIGSATIKTPLDEINRTCFAGAYRYLLDELLTLFPNAQIYFTTISPLNNRDGANVSRTATKIVQQQRFCADIFNANIIDWYRDGQVNSVVNHILGDGTQENPYLWGECTLPNRDTNDQLHINSRGGKKYGYLAAKVIKQTFLGIDEF